MKTLQITAYLQFLIQIKIIIVAENGSLLMRFVLDKCFFIQVCYFLPFHCSSYSNLIITNNISKSI